MHKFICIPNLTDSSLTHGNLTKVLSYVATGDLWSHLNIPYDVSIRIKHDCGDDEEQIREQCIHYYITYSPYALLGWSHIAGRLHYRGEESTERAAKDYVERAPGTCGCGMCMYWNVEDANYDHVHMTQQIHACSDVHCVCSSAFVDYTDAHTDHICAHVHLHTY